MGASHSGAPQLTVERPLRLTETIVAFEAENVGSQFLSLRQLHGRSTFSCSNDAVKIATFCGNSAANLCTPRLPSARSAFSFGHSRPLDSGELVRIFYTIETFDFLNYWSLCCSKSDLDWERNQQQLIAMYGAHRSRLDGPSFRSQYPGLSALNDAATTVGPLEQRAPILGP